jgi:hypothetical protein
MPEDQAQTGQEPGEHQLIVRILDSELFRKSNRTAAFLRFIFDKYSQGRASSINEQLIGVEVFGRQPGYNAGDDSIVRSQARFLRMRLEEYFASEGNHETLLLEIPKGSYIPVFKQRTVKTTEPSAAEITKESDSPPSTDTSNRSRWQIVTLASVILLMVTFSTYLYKRTQSRNTEASILRTFWSTIFAQNRNVILVPADSGLMLLKQASGEDISLQSYINKDYLKQAQTQPLLSDIAHAEFTNIIDVYIISRLVRIPEAEAIRPQVRFARDLSLKELKSSNAVLIGSKRANPWVEIFASAVHLDIDYDRLSGHNVVRNRAPGPGEVPLYVGDNSGTSITDNRQYGVIAYTPSPDNEGHTLLIEGTTKAGTEAAEDFLESSDFVTFLESIKKGSAPIPSFELLITSGDINDASYHPTVVCWHLLNSSASK